MENIVIIVQIIKMKLTNKQRRGVKRQISLELGDRPPASRIFVSKKIYTRKKKHKNGKTEQKIIRKYEKI